MTLRLTLILAMALGFGCSKEPEVLSEYAKARIEQEMNLREWRERYAVRVSCESGYCYTVMVPISSHSKVIYTSSPVSLPTIGGADD